MNTPLPYKHIQDLSERQLLQVIVDKLCCVAGKYILDIYGGAAAAYSLRSLSKDTIDVVRVRRSVDNAEADFTAREITNGTLENWVNADMPLPLDTATAAAAYSLRNLKTSYTGSVIRVRRSSDNAEADFTAAEVADGTLEDWVNTDVDVYTSDFTSGNEDLNEENGVATDGETIDGVSDAYKFTLTGGSGFHSARKLNFLDTTKTYRVTFDYYLPSSNTSVDGLFYFNSVGSNETFNTLDEWVTITKEGACTNDDFWIRATDGGNQTVDADGDVFYLKNIVVTQTTADGHVTTWYDQAGSNDATQGTAANQPKIVDAGVLVEENGRPALEFTTSTSTEMLTSASGTYSQPNTYFIIAKNNNVNSDFIDGSILVDRNLNDISSGFHRMFAGLSFQSTFPNTANQFLRYSLFDGASSEIAIDAASVETGDVGLQGLEKSFRIGDNTSAFLMQEIIIYNSDQSSNRTTIETNINDYYSIYAQDRDGFVTTWYDQSGNGNNAVQNTATQQPQIVSAGVLVEENGKPAIDFGTILENKCLTVNTSPITNNFVTIVHNIIYKNNKNQVLLALSNSNYIIITATDAGKLKYVNSNDDMISTTNVGSFQLSTIDINDGKLYTNNLEEDNVTTASGATSRYVIGNYTGTSGNELEGYVSEIVTWQTAQTSNRVGIETNINNHYNIYP